VTTFHNSLLNFAWISNFSKLACIPVNIVYLCGLCMMSAPREKISKGKLGFIERVIDCFERYPRRLQLLFLNDVDKSCSVKYSRNLWFVKRMAKLLCKKVPSLENLQIAYCENYRNIPCYSCQRSAVLWLLS